MCVSGSTKVPVQFIQTFGNFTVNKIRLRLWLVRPYLQCLQASLLLKQVGPQLCYIILFKFSANKIKSDHIHLKYSSFLKDNQNLLNP